VDTLISWSWLWRSFRPKIVGAIIIEYIGDDPGRLIYRKLAIQNKRDVSTNTKQIYFRHYAIIQAFQFRGEIET
jgi:hypothetical protein